MASHTDLKLRLDPTTAALDTYRIDDPYRTLASPSQNHPIAESTTPITLLAYSATPVTFAASHIDVKLSMDSTTSSLPPHRIHFERNENRRCSGNPTVQFSSVQLFEYISCCDSSGLFRSLALSASPSQPHSLSLTLSTSLCQPQSVSLTLTASLSQPYSHSLILSASLSQLHSLSLTRTASLSQPHSLSLTLSASLSQPHSLSASLSLSLHSPSAHE